MLQISIRALLVGVGLVSVLAAAANAFSMPDWSIYVAFVAIIVAGSFVQHNDDRAYARTKANAGPHAHS